MTPEKRARLIVLQQLEREVPPMGRGITTAEEAELTALRTELAQAPEVADDPRTPFIDESSRPLLGGGDYLEQQRMRSCDEAKVFAVQLVERFGREIAKVALEAALGALKR